MADVVIYRTQYCPYCDLAEGLFDRLGVEYDEIDVTNDAEERARMVKMAGGKRTVPQIFINGVSVGGYDSVSALHSNGKLEAMLQQEASPDSAG